MSRTDGTAERRNCTPGHHGQRSPVALGNACAALTEIPESFRGVGSGSMSELNRKPIQCGP